MKYKIYASLKEDINEGICWVNNPKLPSRSIIRIFNKASNKKVFCEAFRMDSNFVKHYNERPHTYTIDNAHNNNIIVLNEWYRVQLGDLTTQSDYELEIKNCKYIWGKFRASIQHPQIVIRLATWLSTISVILGLVGLILGIWSLYLTLMPSANLQQSARQSAPQANSANRFDNTESNR